MAPTILHYSARYRNSNAEGTTGYCGELLSRNAAARGLGRSLLGRRFVLPKPVAVALERVFDEPVDGVIIIERSRYARAHPGMSGAHAAALRDLVPAFRGRGARRGAITEGNGSFPLTDGATSPQAGCSSQR